MPIFSNLGKLVTPIQNATRPVIKAVANIRTNVILGTQGLKAIKSFFGSDFETRTRQMKGGTSLIEGAPGKETGFAEKTQQLKGGNSNIEGVPGEDGARQSKNQAYQNPKTAILQPATSLEAEIPSDFITFGFKDVVNNKNLYFRATLTGITDTVSPEWASEKYIGRPDPVYVYQGATREVGFDFIVAPLNNSDMNIQWEKLNYLIGLCYPSLSSEDRMIGPIIELTIGDMFQNVPGFLSSLSVTVNDQSPWDILSSQRPRILDVSCGFTYIGNNELTTTGEGHYGQV